MTTNFISNNPETTYFQTVFTDYIKNIDFSNQKQKRAGVVIYGTYGDTMVFMLGIDTNSGNITDFGGGIKLKYETPLEGGLREFVEESLGVFGDIKENELADQIMVYTEDIMIVFIHFKIDFKEIMNIFSQRLNQLLIYGISPEVNSLILMTKDQFIQLVEGGKVDNRIMYDKIRSFLKNAIDKNNFVQLL